MKKSLFSLLTLASLSFNTFAGDYSEVRIIGADDKGKYLSFIEYGTQDGAGINYATLKVLDIAENKYVHSESQRTEEGDDENTIDLRTLRTNVYRKSRLALKSFDVSKANMDLVNFLVVNPATEIATTTVDQATSEKHSGTNFALSPLSTYSVYNLDISSTVDEVATKARCSEDYSAEKIKVTLTTPSSEKIVFQEDTVVPKSRGCASNYKLLAVVSLDKKDGNWTDDAKIVSIISYESPGFEGPDTRVIAVSGSVKTR